jgi:hypothetical protein
MRSRLLGRLASCSMGAAASWTFCRKCGRA